ncbi:hypothetical protein HGB13_05305, partial [bacterium]|nr:hypothetical protein [bacterium]
MNNKQNIKDIVSGKDYAEKNYHKKGLISNLDSLITSDNQSQEYIKINLSLQKLNTIIFNLLIIFSISFFCFTLIFTVS